jgi:hypothetical protein
LTSYKRQCYARALFGSQNFHTVEDSNGSRREFNPTGS